MRRSKRTILFLVVFSFLMNGNCFAQKDTTYSKEFKTQHDTTQLRILVEMSDTCEVSEIIDYTGRAIIIGKRIKENSPQSEYIEYYAAAYNNEAYYYDQVGNIKGALESNLKSLNIREETNDSLGMAESYNNIAFMLQQQGDYSSAVDYYNKAKKIHISFNNEEGLASVHINLGYAYYLEGKIDSSQVFFELALDLAEKINDVKATSYALNNLASIYNGKKMFDKSEEFYLKSLKLREQIGSKDGVARSHYNLGRFYYNRKNYEKSFTHAHLSYELAKELKSPDIISTGAILLSDLYAEQNNHQKAFEFLTIHLEMKDSILSDETRKTSIKQKMTYEFEKQKAIDDAAHEKQLAISAEQEKKQKVIIYAIAGGLALVILFSIVVLNRLQVTRKQKLVIEEQKQEVENQKVLVEVKNQEITDSINYAKRIQSAILPPDKVVKEYLRESFILYKPKDIVAGDFYWMESVAPTGKNKSTKVLFAAADCTGHGVPGAMVSVVCNNALNRSVREHGLTDPGKILDKTREIVIQEFEKSDEEVKDGMDIALCSMEGKKLQYAGAHNPLWIIRNGEIVETKANKQPIGKFDNQTSYDRHSFDLEDGDTIYIFSDGYVDQFGGENGKKFKAKAFRELLLSIQKETMEEQKKSIDDRFNMWKGNLEQIDDVCVIGVRV